MSVWGGVTGPSSVLRKTGLAACALLVAAVAGCGGGEGVAQDATVTAYVEASSVRWREARACEPRWASWRASGASCLPPKRSEPRQAQSGHSRRKCSSSHGGFDHGGLPGSFRPCCGSLHSSDLGNRRGPVDRWKLGQSRHGSPPRAHRSFGLRLPAPVASRRTPRVVERGGRPLPKHSRAAPAARFGRGRPALPRLEQICQRLVQAQGA